MRPIVTVSYGGLSADARLPGWTAPFLVRIAERIVHEAANGGPPLRVVAGEGAVRVVDDDPAAFAREFGASGRPAAPRLGPAAAAVRAGGGR